VKLGIGHTQLTEFAAFLDEPSLSCSGYVQIQSNAAKAVSEIAWDEIKKAGEEERKLAIQYGDIDSVPMITVVADGQWSKRSYKTKYDALSGVVNIIIIIIYYLIITHKQVYYKHLTYSFLIITIHRLQ